MITTSDPIDSSDNNSPGDDKPNLQLNVGDIHEVTVEKIVYGGDGLARINSRPVFIPYSATGDRLKIRITEVEKKFSRASVEEILIPSVDRRPPPCQYFGICGGCQLQHINYEAQLKAKTDFIRESLFRIGKLEWTSEIPIRHNAELGYRSRAEIKVARSSDSQIFKLQLGYFRYGTHDICEVDECAILLPPANRELHKLHENPSLLPSDATRVYLTVGDDEVLMTPADGQSSRIAEFDALGTAHQTINGIRYGFGVRSFFQANRLLVEELLNTALGNANGKFAVDFYAGVGLFSMALSKRFEQVCAVEGNKTSANHGIENAKLNNINNVRYESISVEAWLKYKAPEMPKPDMVLLDPPRAGAGNIVTNRLIALAPPLITYISCDPATLARDLRMLVDAGYHISSITAIDMFPQTFHVETVVHLSL